MRVLIGVEHELLRYGLIQLLKDVQTIEYMAEVSTTEEFIRVLKKYQFDLVVVDANLQGAGGLISILSTLEILPKSTKRVFMYNEPVKELENLFTSGVLQGLFYERSTLEILMDFFQKIMSGEQAQIPVGLFEGESPDGGEDESHDLSKREEEVFHMKVRGYTVKETADLLNISPKTVENHRRNIRKKLNIVKNNEWYEWGKQMGLI